MVRFGPYMNYSDPSYHVPAFFELFSKSARSTQQYFWSDVATKSRIYLAQTTFKNTLSNGTVVTNSSTGLFPDQAGFNGVSDSNNSQTVKDRNFSYDAWRRASHIAMDYTLWGAADNAYRTDELTVINKYLTFMKNQNYVRTTYEYTLNGTAVITGQPVGLLAATTGAAIATSNSSLISGFSSALTACIFPTITTERAFTC